MLEERNITYEVFKYAPEYFMIGQDGDLGYFIEKVSNSEDVYSLDLGALGSCEMEKEAKNIYEFIYGK